MISKRLRNLFLICIPLFVLHGIEEYLTGFYDADAVFRFLARPLSSFSVPQAVFLTFQISFWFLLSVTFLLLLGRRWILRLMSILGLLLILEPLHVINAAISGRYYPGMITAALFPIIAFFVWKELIQEFTADNLKS